MNRIFLIGFMGCGKTTAGRYLAQQLQWQWIDLDRTIEEACQKTVAQIFSEYGEDYFRSVEQATLQKVVHVEQAVISTGGGTPCFYDNMALMQASGLTCYLRCPVDVLTERIAHSNCPRPLMQQSPEQTLRERIAALLEQRKPFYEEAEVIIDRKEDVSEIFAKMAQTVLPAGAFPNN